MSTKKKNPERSPRETILDAGQIKTPDDAPDPEVKEEFDEAQHQSPSGSRRLVERVSSSDPQSPDLTDGALDAAWDGSDVDEESPDGSAPSPDQNVVDELGKQAGLTFNDDEPIDAPEKAAKRDRDRWELDPASSEDFNERQPETAAVPKSTETRPKTKPKHTA